MQIGRKGVFIQVDTDFLIIIIVMYNNNDIQLIWVLRQQTNNPLIWIHIIPLTQLQVLTLHQITD